MAAEKKKALRIAVVSGKGGVGKSIITANLAAALSSAGRKILVFDADLGLANLDVILGIAPPFTIYDTLHGNRPLDEVVVSTTKGFDLIPAGSGLPEGAMLTEILAENVESFLGSLEYRYDAVLFDAGAGIGDVVLFFANLADEILLVVTPEPTSLLDAYAIIKILHQLHGKNEFLLVVNLANPNCIDQTGASIAAHLQNVISRYLESDDRNPVRVHLIASIPVDPAVPHSVKHRQLLAEMSPEAPSTCRMHHLADFLGARISVQTNESVAGLS
jgi:flagellar biosynthesis protein FlhG